MLTQVSSIEVLTTVDRLGALGPSWDGLRTYLDAPYASYRWVLSSAEALASDSELHVAVIRRNGVPIAAAPLVRRRGFFSGLQQLGTGDHGEPGDFSYRDQESLVALAKALARHRLPLALGRVPQESPVLKAINRAYRWSGLVISSPRGRCPFIEIKGTEAETLESLPASLRSDIRRGMRKAEKIGAVRFEQHAPGTEAELSPLWDESLDVEAASWKGRLQTALKRDQRIGAFYRSYAVRACEEGALRVFFLRIGGRAAAMMIGLECSDRFWILKIGYDESFAPCSPGQVIMYEGLRYACHRGLKSYEFLGTAAAWTRRWTNLGRENLRVLVYPVSVKGVILLARDTSRSLREKIRARRREKPCPVSPGGSPGPS
jgi:CelD/BcsL family acetyltransferase involved in cellulose biosynthesis